MTVSLPALLAVFAGSFLFLNLVFAVIYHLTGGLSGVRAGTLAGAFFFSVQTLSTTGYGAVYPTSLTANFIAVLEMVVGLLGTAVATGVVFARLSRPRSRVMFSRPVIIRTYRGIPTLMFRLANERRNQIVEARITVTLTHDELDEDGSTLRRMVTLKLIRDVSPVFALSWLVMHPITEASPLNGKTEADIAAGGT